MWVDVVDLRDFYAGAQGQAARRVIRQCVRRFWPDVSGQRVLGLGFAAPYLGLFRSEAERVMCFMPASQGVMHWPSQNHSLTALVEEDELPLADASVDRVILAHALECTEQLRPMMREIWRVLSPSGRLLVIVPNRHGLWARFERTPFGHGRPYSRRQISRLLRETLYTPETHAGALFVPPSRWRVLLAGAPAWEQIGRRWFERFSGVAVVEASKQIYATPVPGTMRRRRLAFPVPRAAVPGKQPARCDPAARIGAWPEAAP